MYVRTLGFLMAHPWVPPPLLDPLNRNFSREGPTNVGALIIQKEP